MFISLATIKKHLNIDSTFTDDDAYLTQLETVSAIVISKHIDIELSDIVRVEGGMPLPLQQAMLLFIGNLYANREPVSYTAVYDVPKSYDYLLDLYKNYNNTNYSAEMTDQDIDDIFNGNAQVQGQMTDQDVDNIFTSNATPQPDPDEDAMTDQEIDEIFD